MRTRARHAVTAIPDGHRVEARRPLSFPATLHADAAEPRAVAVSDLTARGCRVAVATGLPSAAYVSLMMAGATLISGRVAWNDGAALGVDFCAPLLPRIVARLTALGVGPAA